MNDKAPKNPLSDSTVALLRAPLPGHDPRPGFETRLMANIHEAGAPKAPRFTSPWLFSSLGTTVLVAAIATALLRPAPPETITAVPPAETRPVLQLDEFANPLEDEALAMRSSATRVGRFLLSHLPSLPDPEGESL